MMKHLSKTFLIGILSGSLLTFQSSVVFAAGTNTTDANGVVTNTQAHTLDKVNDADMLLSLAMLGNGFLTGRMLYAYRPVTTDVMVAAAGGVAFIAGEILSNVKFKGTIDAMTVEVEKKTDGTVNEEQIQRLQDLKKSYEEAKNTTKTKKTLQLASAAAFTAASVMAAITAHAESVLMKSCFTALATAQSTCLDAIPYNTAFTALDTARQFPGPSHLKEAHEKTAMGGILATPFTCSKPTGPYALPRITAAITAVNSSCKVAITTMEKNQVFTFDIARLTASNPLYEDLFKKRLVEFSSTIPQPLKVERPTSYFDLGLDLIFAKAQASWLPMLGLGVGTAAAFFPILATAAAYVDLWMYVPFNRMLVFTSLAGTAYLASKSSDRQIAKLDLNIQKIDKILLDLNKMAVGMKAQNLTQQQIAISTINPTSQSQLNFSPTGNTKTPCLTNNNTENCVAVTDQLKNMPGFANLPDAFKDIASQATTLGDNLSGSTGISGSTLASADSLGSKTNAISKLLKDRQSALEKLSNKFNVQKGQDKFLDGLKNNLKDSLKRQGMTASGMMASLGQSGISGIASAKVPDNSDSLKKSVPAAVGAIDISSAGSGEKDKTLDLNFKDASTGNVANLDMSGGTSSAKNPEYDIDSKEINGENGPTLFELLSNRYIKSGYPKLLEEEPVKK